MFQIKFIIDVFIVGCNGAKIYVMDVVRKLLVDTVISKNAAC
jgi:hypothetical protein